MASSSDHPRDPTSAPVEGVVASQPTVLIHPELLRDARRGDYEGLKVLLRRENGAVVVTAEQIVVEVRDSVLASGTLGLLPQCTRAVAVADEPLPLPSSSPTLLAGVTFQGDSALHVVAASGDGPAFIKCAGLIYQEAKHLLDGPNNNGDTPLHCAARAGHGAVVSRLIALAGHEQGGDERAKEVLTRLNGRRETVLHDAVRFADEKLVCELMSACPSLARFPGDGTSALYLAISLGHDRIVDLLHSKDPELSYSGPAGQNALHAASLHGREMTQKILEWSNKEGNNAIIGHVDESGSTPLHFAASAEGREMEEASNFVTRFLFRRPMNNPTPIHLLLDADQCSACRPDNRGQYPIHIAASAMGKLWVVALILDKCPECAGLRDARGRTFLHVAIDMRRENIVDYATKDQRFASILNMQDNGGNTALHLAVQVGVLRIFRNLLRNKRVSLNLANDKGQTPADLSRSTIPAGLYYKTNARMWILWSLVKANARNGNDRRDHFQEKHILKLDESKESKKMTEAAQMTGIGSVLVATMAFAAAFTMPGGYIASEHKNGGTPTLAGSYAFDAFMYAVAVAFICSMLATFSLMYSGMATVDWKIRNNYFNDSLGWMWNSSRSLLAAFALGVYLVLAPVAGTTAIGVCILTSGTLLFRNREVGRILICTYTLHKRLGIFIWVRLATRILPIILQSYFVYIVIFVSPVCFHGILKHFPILGSSK